MIGGHFTKRAFSTVQNNIYNEPSFFLQYGMTIFSTTVGIWAIFKGNQLYKKYNDVMTWPIETVDIIDSNCHYKDSSLFTPGWILTTKLQRKTDGDVLIISHNQRLSRDMFNFGGVPDQVPSDIKRICDANGAGELIQARISPEHEFVCPELKALHASNLVKMKKDAYLFMTLGSAACASAMMREAMKFLKRFGPK